VSACPLHGGRQSVTNVAGWETTPAARPGAPAADHAPSITGSAESADSGQVAPSAVARRAARQLRPEPAGTAPPQQAQQPKKEGKKGFFRRLLGVFK
jgi:hypothetical protein